MVVDDVDPDGVAGSEEATGAILVVTDAAIESKDVGDGVDSAELVTREAGAVDNSAGIMSSVARGAARELWKVAKATKSTVVAVKAILKAKQESER